MKKVLLLRSRSGSHARITEALLHQSISFVDISDFQEVEIGSVGTHVPTAVHFAGHPIATFDRILFSGVPQSGPWHESEFGFAFDECQAALFAAVLASGVPLIHLAATYYFTQRLLSKEGQLAVLRSLGWATPAQRDLFDFRDETMSLVRTPAVEPERQILLVVSQKRWLTVPIPNVALPDTGFASQLIWRTQNYLRKHSLGFVSIPLILKAENAWAFGMALSLPELLARQQIRHIVEDLVW